MKKKSAAFIVLYYLLKEKEKKGRRYWIKDLYKHRRNEGGDRLLTILGLDETNGHFKNFLRVSVDDFELFINLIGPKVEKQNTKFICEHGHICERKIGTDLKIFSNRTFFF